MALEKEIIPSSTWGRTLKSTPPKMVAKNITAMTVHYTGAPSVNWPKNDIASRIKRTEASHVARPGENMSTIGYNFIIDKWGRIWEARGWDYRNGANGARSGEKSSNDWSFSVCVLVGVKDNKPTPEIIAALQLLYSLGCKRFKRQLTVTGHRDHKATSCPGEDLYKLVKSGKIQQGAASPAPAPAPAPAPVPPAAPAPAPVTPAPAPQPAKPAAGTYTVVRGDSYWKIAEKVLKRGSRWEEISKLNNGVSLKAGMTIKVPKK